MVKPTIGEVIAYAKPIVLKFIGQLAADLPYEQKEEIEQSLMMRLVATYDKIEADQGWKSFVYNHCRGAVLDYLKFGKGFQEGKWSLQNGKGQVPKIHKRVQSYSEDGEPEDIDHVLGQNGLFESLGAKDITIKWELVARLASEDIELHVFAKHLLGFHIEEMEEIFGLCRTRIGQLMQAFLDRFDDPVFSQCEWFHQTCYALGICRELDMDDVDAGIGHSLTPVDLFSTEKCQHLREQDSQMVLFDVQQETE